MTHIFTDIDWAEIEIDSHSQQTLEAFADLYPRLEPQTLYCTLTGSPIGITPWRDLHMTLAMLEGEPDERANELATRILASSRPGLFWNKIRVVDVDRFRAIYPRETLCYLLNGASGVPKGCADFFAEIMRRIEQFQHVQSTDEAELDSMWYDFYRAEQDALAESQRAARMMRHWLSQTDPIGQKARHDSVIARLHEEAELIRTGKKRARVRPIKVVSEKEAAKAAKYSMAAAFLDSVMNGIDLEPTAPLPIDSVPAARPAGAGFRIKMPSAPAVTQEA